MLPILSHREQIKTLLHSHNKLIVTAPPGTGKSTQIPQFFMDELSPDRQMIVLQPRRIAARSLASRVAEETGSACGETVGYQVRFERKVSSRTRVCFQTYGTFVQLLQSDPAAASASIIVFDEFHERTLEADALLAWVRFLSETVRPDLRIIVLSATLETGHLAAYLEGSAIVNVAEKSFPVALRYQQPKALEPIADQVDRALNALFPMENPGSVLVFLPGVYEIERAGEKVHDTCRRRGFRLMTLHGRMKADAQSEVLRAPAREPCVILATNVAETSLTIPGVTAVIDSGLARRAAYDPERDRNTLFVSRISLQNAAQRTGRAGRLSPGVCVRLWSHDDERVMPETISPEILRLDLTKSALSLFSLGAALDKKDRHAGILRPPGENPVSGRFGWLTPPAPERWNSALETLLRCGATLPAKEFAMHSFLPLTSCGALMARLPVEPPVAAVLLASRTKAERAICIAMAAVRENGAAAIPESQNLFLLAEDLLQDSNRKEFGRECHETRDQLDRMVGDDFPATPEKETAGADLKKTVTISWMRIFSHRMAARQTDGSLYLLGDGRTARLVLKKKPHEREIVYPQLIVALVVHERGGRSQGARAQARQVTVPLFLPLETEWIRETFPQEIRNDVVCRWDEVRERAVIEKSTVFRGLTCETEEIPPHHTYQPMVTACLAAKMAAGAWDWRSDEPRAVPFVYKMKLVAGAYPEMGIPAMNAGDWELVYHELCEGKNTLAEVKKASVLQAVRAYIGESAAFFIDKKAPDMINLPSGKKARVTYFDHAPPEISGRIGDFIGHKERFMLMDGRVQGIFNICAPNYRTVQKTSDLGSFWKNTYPAVRSELKRKYPKHPWP